MTLAKKNIEKSFENKASNLFYILLILHLVPLFFAKYFPTQDGPSHLKNAWMLRDMLFHPDSVFHTYFSINNVPNPNWIVHIVYVCFLTFLPPFLAEKLFLALYVIFLPLSFRYLVRQINPNNSFISLLIFPLIYNITFYFGFLNFCVSIIFYFYAFGYWLKYKGRFGAGKQIIFLLLVTILFFSHPISFLMAGMSMGYVLIAHLVQDAKKKELPSRQFLIRLRGLFIAFLPSLVFFILFLKNSNGDTDFPDRAIWPYILDQLEDVALVYMGKSDKYLFMVFSFILILFIGYNIYLRVKQKKTYSLDVLFILFTSFAILIFFSPDDFANGSFIFMRLALYSNILAIMALSVYPYHRQLANILAPVFFVFAVLFLGYRSICFYHTLSGLKEYRSIENDIPEGKTFLPFSVNNVTQLPDGSTRSDSVDVFLHLSGYISIERKAFSFENYEGLYSYFPLQWKKKYNPDNYFQEGGDTLNDSSFIAYAQKSGIWPDYIYLWGEPDIIKTKKYLLGQLDIHYSLFKKTEHGYGWLYRRKD